jgi:hypothetical protein
MNVSINHTLQIQCATAHIKSSNRTLNRHRPTACILLQLRTSRGYLLPGTDSSLNQMNSVIYIAEEWTIIRGNTCHFITTHLCVTSPRTQKTPPPLLLRVGPCLESCCLATRWSNPLQYVVCVTFEIHVTFLLTVRWIIDWAPCCQLNNIPM